MNFKDLLPEQCVRAIMTPGEDIFKIIGANEFLVQKVPSIMEFNERIAEGKQALCLLSAKGLGFFYDAVINSTSAKKKGSTYLPVEFIFALLPELYENERNQKKCVLVLERIIRPLLGMNK